jgi:Coenzyme PQQ synthesis protein D (PqqD)
MVTYRQHPRAAGRVIDGVAFVITPDDHKLHSLNGTGTQVWQRCAGGATLDDVTRALVLAFQVDETRARADAERFLSDLVARQLLAEEATP